PVSNQTVQIPLRNISRLDYSDAKQKYPVIVNQIISEIPDEVVSGEAQKWNNWKRSTNNTLDLILKNWDNLNNNQKNYFIAQGVDNNGKWENYKRSSLCCVLLPPWYCSKEGEGQICFSFPWKATYQKGTLTLDIYYNYQPEECVDLLVEGGTKQKCCCQMCDREEDCSIFSPDEQNFVWYFYLKDPGKTKDSLLKMGNLKTSSTYYTINEDKDNEGKLLGLYIFPK
ncbi:MAG: hypothetical protein PHO31_00525, partial [Candidatus Pacebacteria bacterium]|nr:hypothetical protein [Candidatus Paceibacterota bacterium]